MASDAEVEELNKFLRSHRILQVDKSFSPDGGGYWSILVTYHESGAGDIQGDVGRNRSKVDYSKVLAPEVYARFEALKAIRREVSKSEGISAFLVFTDKELARMAEPEELTLERLQTMEGIERRRIEKYATAFVVTPPTDTLQ